MTVTIEAMASGIITQPAAATMLSSVLCLPNAATASSAPEDCASSGPAPASSPAAVKRSRFMRGAILSRRRQAVTKLLGAWTLRDSPGFKETHAGPSSSNDFKA